MTYSAGDRVTHNSYGHGTITSVDEYHTRILFDEHGLRTFVSSAVVLATSEVPAPAPAKKKAAPRRKKAVAPVEESQGAEE